MIYPVKSPKKLIEVALPLNIISTASSCEKFFRHGHSGTVEVNAATARMRRVEIAEEIIKRLSGNREGQRGDQRRFFWRRFGPN